MAGKINPILINSIVINNLTIKLKEGGMLKNDTVKNIKTSLYFFANIIKLNISVILEWE